MRDDCAPSCHAETLSDGQVQGNGWGASAEKARFGKLTQKGDTGKEDSDEADTDEDDEEVQLGTVSRQEVMIIMHSVPVSVTCIYPHVCLLKGEVVATRYRTGAASHGMWQHDLAMTVYTAS